MKLVHNWRDGWKWLSVQFMTLQGAAAAAWLSVPEDMRAAVPPEWLAIVAVVLTVLGVIGRMIDQGGANAGKPD